MGSRSSPLLNSFNGTSLAVSHWKLRMDTYGWVSIQPSQPKQAIFRIGFNVNVFFSRIYRFSFARCLHNIGLNALTHSIIITVPYINCTINYYVYYASAMLIIWSTSSSNFKQNDFMFVKMSLFCPSLGPAVVYCLYLKVLATCASSSSVCYLRIVKLKLFLPCC